MKCPKSGFLKLIISGWSESGSGKAVLNEIIVYSVNSFSSLIACYLIRLDKQFFWALSKYSSGKDGSAPLEQNCPYAYAPKLWLSTYLATCCTHFVNSHRATWIINVALLCTGTNGTDGNYQCLETEESRYEFLGGYVA